MRNLFLIFLTSITLMFSGLAIAEDKIYLNTGIRAPFTTPDRKGFVDRIVAETFKRAGLTAEVIVYQNSARSLENANSGLDDGLALRIKGLDKKYQNLIRIPEKVMDNDFVAYSNKPIQLTDGFKSLDGLRTGYLRGWQIFKNNLTKHKSVFIFVSAQEM
ncbi:MAG: hypothetical protein R3261_00160, partial [Alphaproteobacteria bacterium]|nr:hypothetical protein [Alphaproteobacteria bacterium]